MAYALSCNGTWNTRFCPRKTKANAYQSLVRPVVEYASAVWYPRTKKNITKVESVQHQSPGWVMSERHCTSSVTAMLESLAWPSLETRRTHARIIMLHIFIYSLVDIDVILYLKPAVGCSLHNTLSKNHSIQLQLLSSAVRLWYNIPAAMTYLPLNSLRSSLATTQLN